MSGGMNAFSFCLMIRGFTLCWINRTPSISISDSKTSLSVNNAFQVGFAYCAQDGNQEEKKHEQRYHVGEGNDPWPIVMNNFREKFLCYTAMDLPKSSVPP
jgi:hypothetical protein